MRPRLMIRAVVGIALAAATLVLPFVTPVDAGRGNRDQPPPVTTDGPTVSGNLGQQVDILQNDRSGTGYDPPSCQGGDEYEGTTYEGEAHWRLTHNTQENHGEFRDIDHTQGTFYRYVCLDPNATCDVGSPNNAPEGECYGTPISETWCGEYICFFDEVDPEGLAEYVVDQFVDTLATPEPEFSPPGGTTLVNFEMWMWVPNLESQRQEFDRLDVPGQWVETTATFDQLEWDMGDGSDPVRCELATDKESAQDNGCIHLYERSSAGEPDNEFQGTVSVVWEVTYEGMFGDQPVGPTTFPVLTENEFTLAVAESQAIVVDD